MHQVAVQYGSVFLGPNWAVLVLPYMEQENIFRSVDVNGYTASNGTSFAWAALRSNRIKSFLCPSDNGQEVPYTGRAAPGAGTNWARGNYAANAGPGVWGTNGQTGLNGPGSPAFGLAAGAVMGPNVGSGIAKIEDGSSNTILFAELRVGYNQDDRRGSWALGQPGASILHGGGVGDCFRPNDGRPGSGDFCDDIRIDGYDYNAATSVGMGAWNGCDNWQAQARSRHTGGVNVALSDASVRFIRDSITTQQWYQILSRNDGLPPPSID
jgi:hypothetical protein